MSCIYHNNQVRQRVNKNVMVRSITWSAGKETHNFRLIQLPAYKIHATKYMAIFAHE